MTHENHFSNDIGLNIERLLHGVSCFVEGRRRWTGMRGTHGPVGEFDIAPCFYSPPPEHRSTEKNPCEV